MGDDMNDTLHTTPEISLKEARTNLKVSRAKMKVRPSSGLGMQRGSYEKAPFIE